MNRLHRALAAAGLVTMLGGGVAAAVVVVPHSSAGSRGHVAASVSHSKGKPDSIVGDVKDLRFVYGDGKPFMHYN